MNKKPVNLIEKIQNLERISDLECLGDDGPPYCDDEDQKPCIVCNARLVINQIANLLHEAEKEYKVLL